MKLSTQTHNSSPTKLINSFTMRTILICYISNHISMNIPKTMHFCSCIWFAVQESNKDRWKDTTPVFFYVVYNLFYADSGLNIWDFVTETELWHLRWLLAWFVRQRWWMIYIRYRYRWQEAQKVHNLCATAFRGSMNTQYIFLSLHTTLYLL